MTFRSMLATLSFALGLAGLTPTAGLAQKATVTDPLHGTWEAKTKDGLHTVVIRSDSSASYGDETVRWRIQKDIIWLALGGEWVDYRMKLRGRSLTLSGGDLTEPITLKKVGPPSPREAGVSVPPDPDAVPARSVRKPER